MRISTLQYQTTATSSLSFNQDALATLQEQMASGNRILLPSDDPVSTVRLERLSAEVNTITQYRSNIATVKTRLTQNETFLQGMVNQISSAKDTLVWASDASNSSADLNAQVSTLTAIRDSLFSTANSQDSEGNYLFSGTATTTPAITYDANAPVGSRYSYTGNTSSQSVVVGNNVTQAINTTMQGMDTYLNQLDAAADALNVPGVTLDTATAATVGAALGGSDTALDNIASQIATLGGQQNTLTTLDTNHSNVNLSNQQAEISLSELDYGSASVALNGYTTALQASYKVYAKIGQMSLFNIF
jgi:flagellar hook-associated protein 3 FlgL